ncbi:hypothetical protein QFZ22_008384 [Streptomyces canus]|uniref:Uncharacterized protein n=1 Tax=Streptomyces canus TaxID=58343 RepID=A0AAW8FRD8_9ACTN|nr:hypothetical protein [Streptomyces canus]
MSGAGCGRARRECSRGPSTARKGAGSGRCGYRDISAKCYHDWGNFSPATDDDRVLLHTRTAGSRHANLGAALGTGLNPLRSPTPTSLQNALVKMGAKNGFTADWTEGVTQLSTPARPFWYNAVSLARVTADTWQRLAPIAGPAPKHGGTRAASTSSRTAPPTRPGAPPDRCRSRRLAHRHGGRRDLTASGECERGCEGDSAGEGLGRQPLGLFAVHGRRRAPPHTPRDLRAVLRVSCCSNWGQAYRKACPYTENPS